MNQIDRKRILRFWQLLGAVPFSNQGLSSSTATVAGVVGFEQDMRAMRPYLGKVLEGMLLQGQEDMEEGWDYENPDRLLDALEAWIRRRKDEQWQNASEYDFTIFWKEWKETS